MQMSEALYMHVAAELKSEDANDCSRSRCSAQNLALYEVTTPPPRTVLFHVPAYCN